MSNLITYQNYGEQQNWVNGGFQSSDSNRSIPVISPYFNKEIATIPDSNNRDLDNIVQSAKLAFPSWASLDIRDRAEVMFNLKAIMERNMDELAELIALDNGKTLADAKGSILRGKEVVEFATSLPAMMKGDSSSVGAGVTCTMTHEPLGIVSGITPFNFPAMVPLWMIPLAITSGNCFILKPSEQTPLSALKIAEYLKQSGLPDGVFSIVNGSKEIVEEISLTSNTYHNFENQHISESDFIIEDLSGNTISEDLYQIDFKYGLISFTDLQNLPSLDLISKYKHCPIFKSPYIEGSPWISESQDTEVFDGIKISYISIMQSKGYNPLRYLEEAEERGVDLTEYF